MACPWLLLLNLDTVTVGDIFRFKTLALILEASS